MFIADIPEAPPQHIAITETQRSQLDVRVANGNVTALIESDPIYSIVLDPFNAGEEIMFTVDIPYVPQMETAIILVQAANSTASAGESAADFLLKTCREVSAGNLQDESNVFDPAVKLADALQYKLKRPIISELRANRGIIKIALLEGPNHGQLLQPYPERPSAYHYKTNPGYLGKDKAVFLAEFEGKRYKVVMNLVVVKELSPENPLTSAMKPVCPAPEFIKLKNEPKSGSLEPSLYPIAFADLPTGALGQTVGNNITLDLNAAGYNWFIDTTPDANEEYLPTAEPTSGKPVQAVRLLARWTCSPSFCTNTVTSSA